MPIIGWIFLLLSFALVVGGLLFLRKNGSLHLSKEELERVRKRKAEMEEQERKEDKDW